MINADFMILMPMKFSQVTLPLAEHCSGYKTLAYKRKENLSGKMSTAK